MFVRRELRQESEVWSLYVRPGSRELQLMDNEGRAFEGRCCDAPWQSYKQRSTEKDAVLMVAMKALSPALAHIMKAFPAGFTAGCGCKRPKAAVNRVFEECNASVQRYSIQWMGLFYQLAPFLVVSWLWHGLAAY
eukprot:scaffold679115_cov95-Prasinocladus_malaysianus.AAC.1